MDITALHKIIGPGDIEPMVQLRRPIVMHMEVNELVPIAADKNGRLAGVADLTILQGNKVAAGPALNLKARKRGTRGIKHQIVKGQIRRAADRDAVAGAIPDIELDLAGAVLGIASDGNARTTIAARWIIQTGATIVGAGQEIQGVARAQTAQAIRHTRGGAAAVCAAPAAPARGDIIGRGFPGSSTEDTTHQRHQEDYARPPSLLCLSSHHLLLSLLVSRHCQIWPYDKGSITYRPLWMRS